MIVAPYEADAQLAYLVKEGIADFAISEDSDLIAYGCNKLIMKLTFTGEGKLVDWDKFLTDKEAFAKDKNLSALQAFTREQFIQACIMGGCEYLPSIQQVGLKVALRLFSKHATADAVVESLMNNKIFKDRVPENYLDALKRVQSLFFYQTVYDPRANALTSLGQIPEEVAKTIE